MRVIDMRVFEGKNIYSHKPVIEVLIDLESLSERTTLEFDSFNNHLLELFPNLIDHHCGLEKHGGFVERIKEGTYFAHVLEHLVLELQAILGYEVFFGKTRLKRDPNLYKMIIEYRNEDVVTECINHSIDIIKGIIRKEYVSMNDVLYNLNKVKDRYELGPSSMAIFNEAKKRKIPIRRLGDNSILELGYGKHSRLIQAALTDTTSAIAVEIACNKQLTKQLLIKNNIPVSQGGLAQTIDEALDIAEDIGYPVVLKPLDGNQGKGVVLNLNSPMELEDNFRIPARYSDNILVEKHIEGKDYRVLVVNDKVSAVSERRAPEVTGDGFHTIRELVEMENTSASRGRCHEKPQTKIKLDDISLTYLEKHNLTEYSILDKGQTVKLRGNGNISTGGSAVECTEDIHPDNIKIAVDAAKIIGLDIAGVDITTPDISKPILESKGAVIEVNAVPGLRMHLYPSAGKSINVASDILDFLYPEDTPYSVPIVAITGTNGKTTTARLINHTLSSSGETVGMTTSSGTYIDNKCILEGDNTGPLSAINVLSSKEIDIAILEVARGGLVKRGLGYDLADVAILTNIGDDHIGLDGIENTEDLAFAKCLVLESVKPEGYSVINANDEMAEYFINRSSGNLVLFSKNRNNKLLDAHIEAGDIALCIENNYIHIYDNSKKIKLICINDIPITFKGILECNIENVLAGVSALYSLGTPLDTIKAGLKSFESNVDMNPGRFNMFQFNDIKVMVDYGHNIQGYDEVGKLIDKLNVPRSVGIIGMPGDRLDEQIFNVGSKCSKIFSKVYIKEDTVLRGRDPGEVAGLLHKGLISEGFDADNIKIVLSEAEALKLAVSEAEKGDFITLFYEELAPAVKFINEFKNRDSVKTEKVTSVCIETTS